VSLRFFTAGESHGPTLTAILDGFPAGLALDLAAIDADLLRRQTGVGSGPRMKLERDRVHILSGIMDGRTTGAPLTLQIVNRDHARWQGRPVAPMTTPRPGHGDLVGALKYGYDDLRPSLERASARETAARVAVGSVCRQLLAAAGITVGGWVRAIGPATATEPLTPAALPELAARARTAACACPWPAADARMSAAIAAATRAKETLGGVIEIAAWGLPPGLGSFAQWDQRLDGRLAAALMSVPAIKGVEIGAAFANSARPGTQAQDAIQLGDGGALERPTLLAGGLEAGVTTGAPLLLRAAMKPIPTTLTPQPSVDLRTGAPEPTRYERSDFCPVPRAVVILESMTAFVLTQALLEKLGGDSLAEILPRLAALPRPELAAVHLAGTERIWWPTPPEETP
jgi:chorismate synthase